MLYHKQNILGISTKLSFSVSILNFKYDTEKESGSLNETFDKKEEAEEIKNKLAEVGATVELK